MDLAAVILGLLLGVIAGLVPGIHANTISEALKNLPLPTDFLAFALAGLVGAHSVFELLPAIFLFVPDSGTIVAVLPGHRLFMQGKGLQALRIAFFSAFAALLCSSLAFPLALSFYPAAYALAKPLVFPTLLLLSLALIASEKSLGKIAGSTLVFLLSGALGLVVLGSPLVREPLFPSFAGMFAAAGLLLSANQQPGRLPAQKDDGRIDSFGLLPFVLVGVTLGLLADLFPAIGSAAQMATIASIFLYLNAEKFLAVASAVSVSHVVFAFATTASIGKARIGSIAVIQDLLGSAASGMMPVYAAASVVAALAAVGLVALFGKKFAQAVSQMDSKKMNLAILAYITAMSFIVSGGMGLLVMMTAASAGLLAPLLGVRRTHLMGFLILPTIFYYAGI